MTKKAIEIKQGIVGEIAEKLEKATSCVVVDYKGLTVEEVPSTGTGPNPRALNPVR